eukprot:2886221-Rhodomonas_salina.1
MHTTISSHATPFNALRLADSRAVQREPGSRHATALPHLELQHGRVCALARGAGGHCCAGPDHVGFGAVRQRGGLGERGGGGRPAAARDCGRAVREQDRCARELAAPHPRALPRQQHAHRLRADGGALEDGGWRMEG